MVQHAIPSQLLELARRQAGLVSRRQIEASGVSSARITRKIRCGAWQRATRCVYDLMPDATWSDPYGHGRLRAAWLGLLATDPSGISVGACALALHGAWGLPVTLRPEVALPSGASAPGAAGVRIRRFHRPMSLTRLGGRFVADRVTALTQALPEWHRDTAVAVLDSALNRAFITPADLERIRVGTRGRRGARSLHEVWPLIDSRSQSPLESRARLRCHDAGLPPPTLQAQIRGPMGQVIAHGDLGWRRDDGTWLLVELDGASYHDSPEAIFVDRARQNSIAIAGRHTLLRFTNQDVTDGTFVRSIAAALRAPDPLRRA